MSQIKIQEFIIAEVKVNHLSHLRKGQTIKARVQRSFEKWTKFLTDRGYSEWDAEVIFNDAHDMAVLELRCEAAANI